MITTTPKETAVNLVKYKPHIKQTRIVWINRLINENILMGNTLGFWKETLKELEAL